MWYNKRRLFLIVTLCVMMLLMFSSFGVESIDMTTAMLITVDQSGEGDFRSIQDAIDVVPSNNPSLVFILVKPGIYKERVLVPKDKPNIILSGTATNNTIITWSGSWKTDDSATLSVYAPDFVGRYLTIENTYGKGAAAIAVQVKGDRVAFYSCRMLSYQDTLLDDHGRHYYNNCYIEGATDFICGNGLALFEKCHIHSISRGRGSITAQRRSSEAETTGYSFLDSKITGIGTALLGRPWGHYSTVVFAYSYMSSAISPLGWGDWGNPSNHRTTFYGQYKCYGPGSDTSGRVEWSRDLSSDEAMNFTSLSMVDGTEWLHPPPKHFHRFSFQGRNQTVCHRA